MFYNVTIPKSLRRDHRARGGTDLERLATDIHDGELRVMAAKEPAGANGRLLTHVSVSVGKPGDVHPFRAPTDEEMKMVTSGLFSAVIFTEEYGNDPCVRHLWESEDVQSDIAARRVS